MKTPVLDEFIKDLFTRSTKAKLEWKKAKLEWKITPYQPTQTLSGLNER